MILGLWVFDGAFVCHCVCVFVALDACVCSKFLYSDLMLEPCDELYYEGYEKFVGMVVLGGWPLDMVVYKVEIVEVVFE